MVKKHRGGAPQKVPGGLDRVLYIRADQQLLDKLETMLARQNAKTPGFSISKADLARSILWDGINQADREEKS